MTTQRKLNGIARDVLDRRGRQFVLVDIENLAGGADSTAEDFARVWGTLRRGAIALHPGDVVVVAASRFAARRALEALWDEPVQWRWRDGVDGAESALLDFTDAVHLAQRYSRLVIASGDHAFAPLAAAARRRGMGVHQIVGRGLPSRELGEECTTRARLRLGPRDTVALAA